MIPVGTHGLVCPSDEDYAAFPLMLQNNAEALESALDAQEAEALEFWNGSTYVATTTSAVISNSNAGEILPDGTAGENIVSLSGGVYPRGMYVLQGTASFSAGAVTAGSHRTLSIWVQPFNFVALDINTWFWKWTCLETGTGGDALTVNGRFFSNGLNNYTPRMYISHNNVAGPITVPIGATLRMAYLGSGVVL